MSSLLLTCLPIRKTADPSPRKLQCYGKRLLKVDSSAGASRLTKVRRQLNHRSHFSTVVILTLLVCFLLDGCHSKVPRDFKLDRAAERDYAHPDHVDDATDLAVDSIIGNSQVNSGDEESPVNDDEQVIKRHRRIIVREKSTADQPVIYPLKVKFKVGNYQPVLPTEKPFFRVRSYTTYENQPEIEMVPVTTTVIKPAGVSKEQYIGDELPEQVADELQ